MAVAGPWVRAAGTGRLEALQALRGLGALGVVAYHFRGLLDGIGPGLGQRCFFPGAAAVDLFFLLSGFLFARTYCDPTADVGPGAAVAFVPRRLLRILPFYAIGSLAWLRASGDHRFGVLVKSLALQPLANENPPFFGYAYLLVGWTLNYELVFALLSVPALLVAPKGRLWVLAATVAGAELLLPFVLTGHATTDPFSATRRGTAWLSLATNPLGLEYLAGAALGVLQQRARFRRWMGSRPGAMVTMALAALGCYRLWFVAGATHGLFHWGLPALSFLLAGLAFDFRGARVPRALVRIGDWSFALYLVHLSVALAVSRVPGVPAGPWRFLLLVVVSLTAAALAHRWVEAPLLLWLRPLLGRRPFRATAGA